MVTKENWDNILKIVALIIIAVSAFLIVDGQILGEETVEIGSFLGIMGILIIGTRRNRKKLL